MPLTVKVSSYRVHKILRRYIITKYTSGITSSENILRQLHCIIIAHYAEGCAGQIGNRSDYSPNTKVHKVSITSRLKQGWNEGKHSAQCQLVHPSCTLHEPQQLLVQEWQNIRQAFFLVLCDQREESARLLLVLLVATRDTDFVNFCF